jgi:hypothetical protein
VALAWGDISQDLNRAINQPLQALQLIGQGWSEPIAVASKLTQRIHDKPAQKLHQFLSSGLPCSGMEFSPKFP